jgi:hypothetical protein
MQRESGSSWRSPFFPPFLSPLFGNLLLRKFSCRCFPSRESSALGLARGGWQRGLEEGEPAAFLILFSSLLPHLASTGLRVRYRPMRIPLSAFFLDGATAKKALMLITSFQVLSHEGFSLAEITGNQTWCSRTFVNAISPIINRRP